MMDTPTLRSEQVFLSQARLQRHGTTCRGVRKACAVLFAILIAFAVLPRQALADGLGYDGLPPQELCGLCHGLDGISATAKFPRLAGQRVSYIEKQLRDFLKRERGNDGGQMASIVTEIKPAQFAIAARHFAKQRAPEPVAEAAARLKSEEIAFARDLARNGRKADGIPACDSCHGVAKPEHAYTPYLSAQHPRYLAKQLEDFKSGARSNDVSGTMPAIAAKLTDREIEVLAAYYAAQSRRGG
jgi:cytochrome c553